jgi:hypothetical protein
MLNVPVFLFHGIQGLADEDYRRGRFFFWGGGGGRTTFSGRYVTRQSVILMKPGMICSLPSPAMSLMVEFRIADAVDRPIAFPVNYMLYLKAQPER